MSHKYEWAYTKIANLAILATIVPVRKTQLVRLHCACAM